MILPRISSVWSRVGNDCPMHFVELHGWYNGKTAYWVCVWTETGYVSVVEGI
jgi:hypothetical protein